MCKKEGSAKQLSERSRKTARSTANQKINKRMARHEAYIQNQNLRDTWVEDVDLQFAGVINAPATEEKTIKVATEASEAAFDASNLSFFTHGSSVPSQSTPTKEETSPKHKMKRLAGAAVIYKQPAANNTNGSWRARRWGIGHCESTNGAEAGFFAISKCLTLAAEQLHHAQPDTKPTITIFTHHYDEINKISRVRYSDSTKEQSDTAPVLLDIVKKSQKLRNTFGAAIELYCIPRHAAIEGNRLAEAAARKAASNQDLPAALD